jgi:hypothetical protein
MNKNKIVALFGSAPTAPAPPEIPWYLAGGVPEENCLAAFNGIGARDITEALTNLTGKSGAIVTGDWNNTNYLGALVTNIPFTQEMSLLLRCHWNRSWFPVLLRGDIPVEPDSVYLMLAVDYKAGFSTIRYGSEYQYIPGTTWTSANIFTLTSSLFRVDSVLQTDTLGAPIAYTNIYPNLAIGYSAYVDNEQATSYTILPLDQLSIEAFAVYDIDIAPYALDLETAISELTVPDPTSFWFYTPSATCIGAYKAIGADPTYSIYNLVNYYEYTLAAAGENGFDVDPINGFRPLVDGMLAVTGMRFTDNMSLLLRIGASGEWGQYLYLANSGQYSILSNLKFDTTSAKYGNMDGAIFAGRIQSNDIIVYTPSGFMINGVLKVDGYGTLVPSSPNPFLAFFGYSAVTSEDISTLTPNMYMNFNILAFAVYEGDILSDGVALSNAIGALT